MYVQDDNLRKRQSFVTKEGARYEDFVMDVLLSDEFIKNNAIVLRGAKSESSLSNNWGPIQTSDLRCLLIGYKSNGDNREFLIDNDVVVYSRRKKAIVCVISVKKSFRERGGESAYWALKKNQERKDFKYILVTPDNDDELFKPQDPNKRNKWRSILTAEMDGVFILKEYEVSDGYEEPKFKVGREHLIKYIRGLI